MSTRKTVGSFTSSSSRCAGMAVGMVIASRLDLTPTSSAQTMSRADGEQRAAQRADRRDDVPQHRARRTAPAVVNIQTEVRARGRDLERLLRRRRRRWR